MGRHYRRVFSKIPRARLAVFHFRPLALQQCFPFCYSVCMKSFFPRIPNTFVKLARPVRSAWGRFPVLPVLGLVMVAAVSLSMAAYEFFRMEDGRTDFDRADAFRGRMECLALGCSLGMLVSVAGQLLLERRFGRKVQLVFQAVTAVLSALALPPLISALGEPYCYLTVVGLDMAIVAAILFVFARRQGTGVAAANAVVAFVLAWIFSLCAIAGFFMVYYTFSSLVLELEGAVNEVTGILCWAIPLCVIWPWIFIAYAAREREEISIPAAYKAVVMKVLFPLALALLALLYAYFFKRLFMRSMPVGEINRFISMASAAYLFLYFASLPFEGRFLRFFRKRGALFIAPLLALQVVTFMLRVSEYGYTWTKSAGLFYIAFSVVAVALTVFRKGIHARAAFLVLAAALLLGSVGPLNIEDMTNRSQLARIERIYRSHGLFKGGSPVAEGAKTALSREEMKTVSEAFRNFDRNNRRLPEWARADWKAFESTFGFRQKMIYTGFRRVLTFRLRNGNAPLDVAAWSRIRAFKQSRSQIKGEIAIVIEIDGETFDITGILLPLLTEKEDEDAVDREEPLVIPISGGRSLMLTNVFINDSRDEDGNLGDSYYELSGYLCW